MREEYQKMTDDEILHYTLAKRRELIGVLTKGGVPTDPKDQRTLLTTLSDMDKVALGNKRIGASEKQSAADVLVATAISEISRRFETTDPFKGGNRLSEVIVDVEKLPDANLVPGETDVGLSTQSFKELINKFEQ